MSYLEELPIIVRKKLLIDANEQDFNNMCQLNEFKVICNEYPHSEDLYFELTKKYYPKLMNFKLNTETWKYFYNTINNLNSKLITPENVNLEKLLAISEYYKIDYETILQFCKYDLVFKAYHLPLSEFQKLLPENLILHLTSDQIINWPNLKTILKEIYRQLSSHDLIEFIMKLDKLPIPDVEIGIQ